MVIECDRKIQSIINKLARGALCRADDGLDRPALPVLPAPASRRARALHRDGHDRRVAARRCAAHLDFDPAEHPLALQLGGSEPRQLAAVREAGRALGLRRDQPELRLPVRARAARQLRRLPDGRAARSSPTASRRCATRYRARDRQAPDRDRPRRDYGFVRDFVGTVAAAGCEVFIVHARNAWLKGLCPKENREVPPLRYDVVRRLKRDFPALSIVLNGGLTDWRRDRARARHVDGVMLGREAYHDPYFLAQADFRAIGDASPARSRAEVLHALIPYARRSLRRCSVRAIARHAGLFHGRSGGRRFRQILSDAARLNGAGPDLFLDALAASNPSTRFLPRGR